MHEPQRFLAQQPRHHPVDTNTRADGADISAPAILHGAGRHAPAVHGQTHGQADLLGAVARDNAAPAADGLARIACNGERHAACAAVFHVHAERGPVNLERLDVGQYLVGGTRALRANGEFHALIAQQRIRALLAGKARQVRLLQANRKIKRLESRIAARQVETIDEVAKLAA